MPSLFPSSLADASCLPGPAFVFLWCTSIQGFRDNLEIHEMTKGRNKGEIYVSGLAEFRVKDVEDVLELIQQGSRNRAIRATECNEVCTPT
jgi:hypothetical protein